MLGACVLALSLTAAPAEAVERKYPVERGTLIVDVDVNWSEFREPNDEGEDSIVLQVGDGSSMQWMFLPQRPGGPSDKGFVHALAAELRSSLIEDGAQVSDDIRSLTGEHVTGYYVRAEDPASIPGKGGYKFMYSGAVAVDSLVVVFSIAWNGGGQRAAERALEALKRMRFDRR